MVWGGSLVGLVLYWLVIGCILVQGVGWLSEGQITNYAYILFVHLLCAAKPSYQHTVYYPVYVHLSLLYIPNTNNPLIPIVEPAGALVLSLH